MIRLSMRNCKPIVFRLKMSSVGNSPETEVGEVPPGAVETVDDSTQVVYAIPNAMQFSSPSAQKPRVPMIHKGCLLSISWKNSKGQSPMMEIQGEVRTLLKSYMVGKGSVWIDGITIEIVSMTTTGYVGCCLTSSEEKPEEVDDLLSMPNKQFWYFNNATRGIVHRVPLVIPNSVSQQIIPSSSDYPSMYFYCVRSQAAQFNLVMRVHYSCTKIVDKGDFC